jgi:hypothetical protein
VDALSDVVSLWSAGTLTAPGVAALAGNVLDHYPRQPARGILDDAAAHLRNLVETAERRIGLPDCPRSIAGSLGANSLVQRLIGLPFTPPLHPPERGAILWSRALVP